MSFNDSNLSVCKLPTSTVPRILYEGFCLEPYVKGSTENHFIFGGFFLETSMNGSNSLISLQNKNFYDNNYTYSTWPKVCYLNIMGINMELVTFASITVSTLMGRLSTRCWNIVAGTCFQPSTR
jgi:hypothetical protein